MTGIVEGKVAVVTGGGGAIGRAISLLLAAEGAKVVVNDLGGTVYGTGAPDLSPAEITVAMIREAGGEAIANGDSVSTWESAQKIVQAAADTYGSVDLVVNNAGFIREASFHKISPEDFRAVIDVHLMGSFYVARAAAPFMRRQESGAFVHMTSTAGLIGSKGMSNYAAAKMGIVGLSRSISFDMGYFGVRSNAVAPAAFSRMIEATPNPTPEIRARMERRQRTTLPAHVAPLVVFLLSDAAREINGQILGTRGHEVYLYNQPRPVRALQRSEGWTPAALAERLVPAWRTALTPPEKTADVFGWEPV